MEIQEHTNEVWAEKLRVTPGNVSHWRTGRHAPDIDMILSIAEIAGVSDYFLLTGRPDPRMVLDRLLTARAQLRDTPADENAADAWEQILGQPGLLTEEERQILTGDPEGVRVYLSSARAFERYSLDEEQQRVVRDLVRLLARYRVDPDEPTGSDRAPEP